MPRLTNPRYIEVHHRLRNYWLEDTVPYIYLTPKEQWDLHQFFQPYKTLSDDELIAHRQAVTQQSSSLPHQAGRALKKLEVAAAAMARERAQPPDPPEGKRKRQSLRGPLVVRSLVRPESDAKKLARVLLELVRESKKN